MRLVFDIEANGLTPDKIHCITAIDVDSEQAYDWKPDEVEQGLKFLLTASQLIAHNGIGYDIPAIRKIYPWFSVDESRVMDTLIISRLIWSDLADKDHAQIAKGSSAIGKLAGSHSLAAWGHRLGEHKGDYTGGWDEWSEEMHTYAKQDCVVTLKLWKLIETKGYSQEAIDLEHRVAWIMAAAERKGIGFDADAATKLTGTLLSEKAGLETKLQDTFAPWYSPDKLVTPKKTINYKNKPQVTEGASYTKVKQNVFNAGSRQHIANRLEVCFGWTPTEFSPSGQPKVDETTLSSMTYPEAKPLIDFLTIQKRLGAVAEGKQAWLSANVNGRIHPRYITNGAVTGRATHRSPNISQVPAVRAPWGKECRSLFKPSEGRVMCGVDLSGIELRCLAHFMAKWDDGAYGKIVTDGDVHSANAEALGVDRDTSKRWVYAFLYGAGIEKLGAICGKNAAYGKRLKQRFMHNLPALNNLIQNVQKAATRGYLKGLDGRHVNVRQAFSALNTLLQSAGALVAKRWLVNIDDALLEHGLKDKADLVLWIHDEVQLEVEPEYAEQVKELVIEAARKAGRDFNFRIETAAEGKIGSNWAETH